MSTPSPTTSISSSEAVQLKPPPKSVRTDALLWLVAIGFFMQTLDSTIVNTALPAMAKSLGESPLRMQSVVVGYSLTMAMVMPASGWIADRFGTRKVFVGSIVLFALGSILCALSGSLTQLVCSRVLQAMGGALLMPVGRLAILRAYPRDQFLRALSFVAVPGLIGPLIGPTLGGWLVEIATWHWIFLINIPVAVIGVIATPLVMPRSPELVKTRFDLSGYLMLAFGMVGISLSLEGVSEYGFGQARTFVLLVFGFASIVAYWLHALRKPEPLFSPDLFKVESLRIGLIGNLFARTGSSCMPFLIPLFLQVSMGYSPVRAGAMMLPVALASMGAKPLATKVIRALGYRSVLVGNTTLVGLTMMSFALSTPDQPIWLHIIQLASFGLVNSIQFTGMNTLALKDLSGEYTSSGNSLLSMVQMLAMSLGVAAAGAVLAGYTSYFSHLQDVETLQAFHATFLTMGLMTVASAAIFWQLHQDTKS